MAFSPVSFLLGVGTAYVLPVLSRNFRPIAVEGFAMGMSLLEDVRRVVAEQLENLEDIAAEARARREQLAGADLDVEASEQEDGADQDQATRESAPAARAPRRNAGRRARQA